MGWIVILLILWAYLGAFGATSPERFGKPRPLK